MKKIKLQTFAAVAGCKLTRTGLRLAKKGGTALPGKVAMRFDRDILKTVSDGVDTIVVTGSNGKTTTSHMIETAISRTGNSVLANKSGANMLQGIAAEFCDASTLGGTPKKQYAVIECDEGSMKLVMPHLQPKVIVVTNLYRDQEDRYGGPAKVRDAIRAGIETTPGSILCLNADDPLVASLAENVPNPVVFYGMDALTQTADPDKLEGLDVCPRCGAKLTYRFNTISHLGAFRCPECGCERQTPSVSVSSIEKMDAGESDFEVTIGTGGEKKSYPVHLGLPALYNLYNTAAALAAFTAAGFPAERMIDSLANTDSSFGRMETFDLNGVPLRMILVKNAVSMNQALFYLRLVKEDYNAVFCLNNNISDGTDVSWLKDVDIEGFYGDGKVRHIWVWGMKADALRDRMLAAGIPEETITMAQTDDELVEAMRKSELPVFVLPNYTTMLSLRGKICAVTGNREFWKG